MSETFSPSNDYQAPLPPFPAKIDRDVWNRVFGSVSARIRAIEEKKIALEDLLADFTFNGQARLDEVITPLIDGQRAVLTTLARNIDAEILRINTLFATFEGQTQEALAELDREVSSALAAADATISRTLAKLQSDIDAIVAGINADVEAVRQRVDTILAGGLDAADVNESGTRVFVTPAQRDAIGVADNTKMDKAGGAFLGRVDFAAPTADAAPISLPTGVNPSAPANGDFWPTTAGLLWRVLNVTRTIYDSVSLAISSQAVAEAGTSGTAQLMPPLRVAQAIAAQTGPQRTTIAATSFTAVKFQQYRFVGSTACTATLPASPTVGDTIGFIHDADSAVSHTIARNGRTIMGLAENLVMNTAGAAFTLWWNGSDWRIA